MKSNIKDFCQSCEAEFTFISEERKAKLRLLRRYVFGKFEANKTPKVTVICTHNSRRSHLGQLWLAVGADYYNLPKIETYSGGTEATAFNSRAVTALREIGFDIKADDTSASNPNYAVKWTDMMSPYTAFSKKYDSQPNPVEDFAAILVCGSADRGCPVVIGCDFRLFLPFDDPKAFDDTDLEAEKYSERARQIAREMLFVLSKMKI